jgi:hypothetical protein
MQMQSPIFLGPWILTKKNSVHQKDFVKNLGLLVTKNHLLI